MHYLTILSYTNIEKESLQKDCGKWKKNAASHHFLLFSQYFYSVKVKVHHLNNLGWWSGYALTLVSTESYSQVQKVLVKMAAILVDLTYESLNGLVSL